MNLDDVRVDDLQMTDEESRVAMRAFLQRSEVRLSTLHRVAQALLGGSALVLLLPLFLRDGFPKMMTVMIASSPRPPATYGWADASCPTTSRDPTPTISPISANTSSV